MQKILNVRFDHVTLKQATETAVQWGAGDVKRYICTPNPEMLLAAQKNKKFLKILNHSDLNTPDGIGILWAAKFLKITEKTTLKAVKTFKWLYSLAFIALFPPYIRTELSQRVTGADLMQSICKNCGDTPIFLLGADEGVAEKVKEILEAQYPRLKIVDTFAGSPSEAEENEIRKLIDSSGARILFLAFGAPAQEMWIHRNFKKLKTVTLAVGVGGTFDFISGVRKRAPGWMQKIGLEWLYRLIQQPKRIARIYRATIKFPITILKSRL